MHTQTSLVHGHGDIVKVRITDREKDRIFKKVAVAVALRHSFEDFFSFLSYLDQIFRQGKIGKK